MLRSIPILLLRMLSCLFVISAAILLYTTIGEFSGQSVWFCALAAPALLFAGLFKFSDAHSARIYGPGPRWGYVEGHFYMAMFTLPLLMARFSELSPVLYSWRIFPLWLGSAVMVAHLMKSTWEQLNYNPQKQVVETHRRKWFERRDNNAA